MGMAKEYNLRTKRGQEMRKHAWPAIQSYLRSHSVSTERINKICKPLYLEGVEPLATDRGLYLTEYLMCDPLSTKTQWRKWKSSLSSAMLFNSRIDFMNCQASGYEYAYGNTMFAGREEEIYDYFFTDLQEPAFELDRTAHRPPNRIVAKFLESVNADLGQMRPNRYTQVWRDIDLFERALHAAAEVGPAKWSKEKTNAVETTTQIFCRVGFVCSQPVLFDELVVQNAERLNSLFMDNCLNAPLAKAYKRIVNTELTRFAKSTAAGSRISFAIRYPEAESMQAAYDLLHDATRYPRSDSFPEHAPVNIPRGWTSTGTIRPSVILIGDLWSSGFYVEESGQLDERTFYASTWLPLNSKAAMSVIQALCMNVTDIGWRVRGREGHQDEFTSAGDIGKGVYTLELPSGELRVGTLGYTNAHEATKGFNQQTKRALEQLDSLEESIGILLKERTHIQKIGKKPVR